MPLLPQVLCQGKLERRSREMLNLFYYVNSQGADQDLEDAPYKKTGYTSYTLPHPHHTPVLKPQSGTELKRQTGVAFSVMKQYEVLQIGMQAAQHVSQPPHP